MDRNDQKIGEEISILVIDINVAEISTGVKQNTQKDDKDSSKMRVEETKNKANE